MKKDTARFLKTLLIAIAMLVAVDVTVGVVADKLMDKLPDFSGDLAKDNYRLHRVETDGVILGSSRACYHFVSQQLADSIDAYTGKHYSIYNAGIAAKRANSNSLAAEMLISRYRPQLVIYDIFENALCDPRVNDLEFSAPFYWKDTIVRRYLDGLGLKERLFMKSSLYRYNSKLFRTVITIFSPESPNDGYDPLRGARMEIPVFDEEAGGIKQTKDMDEYTLKNFETVLRKYSSENITLVIVCSPYYRPKGNQKRLAAICEQYGIPFFDFSNIPYFNDHPELFYDTQHLNDEGAHVFTAMLFEQLKPLLQKPG